MVKRYIILHVASLLPRQYGYYITLCIAPVNIIMILLCIATANIVIILLSVAAGNMVIILLYVAFFKYMFLIFFYIKSSYSILFNIVKQDLCY
ncbi:hypothetical protein C2G38_2101070 [Gigaspora rosea]|uniref:Uncharacterized protein n=1 Tax=Gigaspora rosea TaxID=44941 RepID=A0A397UQA0_9GLOM|nr:hypothetical protein C2G38_2101070 [Gigaspora rosea]